VRRKCERGQCPPFIVCDVTSHTKPHAGDFGDALQAVAGSAVVVAASAVAHLSTWVRQSELKACNATAELHTGLVGARTGSEARA